jgi:hypothetical protein
MEFPLEQPNGLTELVAFALLFLFGIFALWHGRKNGML